MPRLLQLLALCFALQVLGAPAWIAEASEDACADECSGDDERGCDESGCTDCPVACTACPRVHMMPTRVMARFDAAVTVIVDEAAAASERVPTGPPPRGIFHPPRLA